MDSSTTRSSSTAQHKHPPPLPHRLLFPNLPPSSPLPPLLISPTSPDLSPELYSLIALALRAYINPWWTKITRYDKEFLPHITTILTTVLRTFEARVQPTDFAPLVFNDLPVLVRVHYRDWRAARAKVGTSYATLSPQAQPHMAIVSLDPGADVRVDEMYMRQVVDHLLRSCLPPEDYAPEPERFIIREVVLKLLVQDVFPKISEPWFIYKVALDLLGPPEDSPPPKPTFTFSFHTLLIFFLSAIQSISGSCLALIHAYKQAVSTIKAVNHSEPIPKPASVGVSPYTSPSSSSSSTDSLFSPPVHRPTNYDPPNYAHQPLAMFSEILSIHDRFASTALMNSIGILSALFRPFLDRLLPHLLYKHLLSPQRIHHLLRLTTSTLFPNGYPAPPPIVPTPAEQADIRAALLRRLLDLPSSPGAAALVSKILLGPTPARRREVLEEALDALGDRACNTHLWLVVFDAVVLRVFPELGVGRVVEMLTPPLGTI